MFEVLTATTENQTETGHQTEPETAPIIEMAEKPKPIITLAAKPKTKRGRPKKTHRKKRAAETDGNEPAELKEIRIEKTTIIIEPVDIPINFYETALKAIDVYLFKKTPDFAEKEEFQALKYAVEDYLNNQASDTVKKYFGEYHTFIILAGILLRRVEL